MMKRDVLIEAVRRTAGELGYKFHTGPESHIPAKIKSMPSVWLSPVKLISEKGRRQCRTTYHLNMYFMAALTSASRDNTETALRTLERDAVEMFHRLAEDGGIMHTSGLKASPLIAPFTKNGETALSVEMDAELFYCR